MITWNDLTAGEQEAMNAVAAQEPNTFFTDSVKTLAQKGLVGLMPTPDKPYMLTVEGGKVYAGRALLPAGEAVDVPDDDDIRTEMMRRKYWENLYKQLCTDLTEKAAKLQSAEADLAAALARAEKAEGEAATAREKGYTDGYAEGTVDGVHDLWNAIVDALNDAGRAGAIKAVHKVLAEYDNLYLK